MSRKNKVLQRISAGIKKRGTAGAFRKEAQAHGESTAEFTDQVEANPEGYSTKTKRRANLAQIFAAHRPH
jgi:hypothetical protein